MCAIQVLMWWFVVGGEIAPGICAVTKALEAPGVRIY